MKTNKFDELVNSILKEADQQQGGSFMSRLGRGLAHVYNAPSTFAKAASKVRSAVETGEIPLKDKEDKENKGTIPASTQGPKAGDTVNVRLRGLGVSPEGMRGKLENPKAYDGGQLYDVRVTGNPQVSTVRILDKPNEKGTMERNVYYFDKNNMPVNPGFLKQKKLNPVGYFGMNPKVDKSKNPTGREWIIADDEYPFLPQDEQPGTPGIPPKRR